MVVLGLNDVAYSFNHEKGVISNKTCLQKIRIILVE